MNLPAASGPDNRRLLNRTGALVAILIVVLLGVALGALMRFDIPTDNHDIILIVVTTVCNSVIGIVGYFFGSSVATARQGDIISAMANTVAANAAASTSPPQEKP
jgi:hypothetical protein